MRTSAWMLLTCASAALAAHQGAAGEKQAAEAVRQVTDNGATWELRSKVADTDQPDTAHNGNPPALVRLRDGRIVVSYGYRSKSYGLRARISRDNGRTWGREIVLRDDGATWDLGYSRSVQRGDGKVLTIYYYTTAAHPEQHIAATIWDPNAF